MTRRHPFSERVRPGLLALCLAVAAPARADEASEAQLQYELGAELYKQGRYAEAIDRFIASHRLVPNPNVVLNIAQTFAYLERHTEAYNWYQTFLASEAEADAKSDVRQKIDELRPKVAVVEVTTEPLGATLYIDRVELGAVGTSPRRIAVTPGARTIIARRDKHRDASAAVTTALGTVEKLSIPLAPLTGSLSLRTTPPGARVRLDLEGTDLGVTPLDAPLLVGEHRVVVTLPGHVEQTRTVRIEDGKTAEVSLMLDRAATNVAVLTIRGNVEGASLLLDGRPLGNAPLSLSDAPAGTRQLDVVADGREPWRGTLVLEPGAATRVDYRLVESGSGPWMGWRYIGFGVGGGLLIGGGVTGGLALQAKGEFDDEPSRDRLDTVTTRNTVADVLFISGAVVVGATVLWEILRAPAPESSATVTIDR